MRPPQIAWIGTIAGIVFGLVGAAAGIALPLIITPTQQPLSANVGSALAWAIGAGMTAMFGVMCAMFGYPIAIRPSRGPRERSFAVVSTAWGSLLVTAFPWFLYGIRKTDPTVAWGIIGIYASIRLIKKWQETQLRIRVEEARTSNQGKSL